MIAMMCGHGPASSTSSTASTSVLIAHTLQTPLAHLLQLSDPPPHTHTHIHTRALKGGCHAVREARQMVESRVPEGVWCGECKQACGHPSRRHVRGPYPPSEAVGAADCKGLLPCLHCGVGRTLPPLSLSPSMFTTPLSSSLTYCFRCTSACWHPLFSAHGMV
jgi:hypothetical protein